MALDPRYYAVRDLVPHELEYDATECTKLTPARNTLLKVLVQVRCADGCNGATPYLAHLSRGVTLGKPFSVQLCVAVCVINLLVGTTLFMATSRVGDVRVP